MSFSKKDSMWLAADVAPMFNETELRAFQTIYDAAACWYSELEVFIIPGTDDKQDRRSYQDQAARLIDCLTLFSELAKATDEEGIQP